MIMTILLFLVLLSALVIAHEWGHYQAARRAKMDIEEFGIGFPPRIFGVKDSRGTLWSLNLIPLGGFVRIKGENGEERDHPGAFASKSFLSRLAVLFGGIAMNIVVAYILFSAGYLFGIPTLTEGMDLPHARITDKALVVMEVVPSSPATDAGLSIGDTLLSIDGKTYETSEDARAALTPHEDGSPLALEVKQGGEVKTLSVTPRYVEEIGRDGVGLAVAETGIVHYPVYLAPVKGAETTAIVTVQIIEGFGGMITGLLHRENVVANLSGPVGIAVITGEVAKLGIPYLIQFAAMLSLNLAVLNAIPFPALDGGRILFLLIEAVRRKPNSETLERTIHSIGFALLLLLVVFVTYKDILKLL